MEAAVKNKFHNGLTQLNVHIPADLRVAVSSQAKIIGVSIRDFVIDALEAKLVMCADYNCEESDREITPMFSSVNFDTLPDDMCLDDLLKMI